MLNYKNVLVSGGVNAAQAAFNSINSPAERGVYAAGLVGGAAGMIDAAVQYGLPSLPDGPAKEVVSAFASTLDLKNGPAAIENVINGALNGGLDSAIQNIKSGIDPKNLNRDALKSVLSNGSMGEVAKVFQDFSNQPSLNTLTDEVPLTASATMAAAGLAGPYSVAMPSTGAGLEGAAEVLGANPLGTILGGGGAFGSLLGGAGSLFGSGGGNPCPCSPKCRKTDHATASNGVNPLESAGALVENNSNKYTGGTGDILNNNKNCLAEDAGLTNTGVGKDLIPSNPLNFTDALKNVPAIADPAGRLENAVKGGAEQSDLMIEMLYSFEAIEKAFKISDNNTSALEQINNLGLVGNENFMNEVITGTNSLLEQNATDTTEHAQAITDLYRMVTELNSTKDGGSANVAPTPAIVASEANTKEIPAKFSAKKAALVLNLIKNILEAIKLLSSLDPELGTPFPDMETTFNESKVLNDSISAKLGASQPTEDTLNYDLYPPTNTGDGITINSLSSNQLDSGEFDTLLGQINDEQKRARRREGDCS